MDYTKLPGKKLNKYGKYTNKEKPTISIVTPFYNGGEFVEETYNCIMNQTYPYFEWIIVNDGSKDEKSNKIIEEISKRDPRIKYYMKENAGPSIARDYGISKASKDTKYVFFIDCDDQMDPTMLECLYWALETNKDASFAYTAMINFGDKEFLWEKYLTIEQEKEENLINIASMVRKEDLLEVGCFGIKEKAMYEDWNLWLKLIKAGKKPLRINAPLFWYRFSSNGEFSRANKNKEKAMKYVNETASTITNDILEPIQYPRYGNRYAKCKDFEMILPQYQKNNRKTILFIFPWMVVGGADVFNLELLKRLPKDKYNSIVLTTTPNRNPLRQEFENHATIYDMSSFIDRINYQEFTDYIIKSRNVDVVFISNSEYGYYMTPYLKSKYPTIPFIDYIHSVDNADPRRGVGRCSRDVDNYLYGTYCCNNFTKNQLKEKFDKTNVSTVYIGTDQDKFDAKKFNKKELKKKYDLPEEKKIISFIARFSEEKRPEMFVEIAKRIHEKDSNTYFVMGGDGPLMENVKEKVNNNFKLLGMVTNNAEFYAFSDITINCSSLEGLALTSYESLAMSVPVVSTDVGGQTELIDNTVGGIVHYNKKATKEEIDDEINQYVEETLRVLNNLKLLKENCRSKITEKFSFKKMASTIENIINESIEKEKNRKMESRDKTEYELACESFYTLYYNYTNDYYEKNLGVYLTAKKSKYQTFYRHIRQKLEIYGAVKEGKDIIEFVRNAKRFAVEFCYFIKRLIKAIIATNVLIFKIIKRIVTKPFRKRNI